MKVLFEVIALIVLCLFLISWLTSDGLHVSLNGKDYSFKIGKKK